MKPRRLTARIRCSPIPAPRGFEGKVALITGARAGSAGRWRCGWPRAARPAIVNYKRMRRRRPTRSPRSQRLGATGMAIRADLESLEEIEAMFDQVQERFGRLDFFVSNASASNFHHFMDLKPHHLERTFNAERPGVRGRDPAGRAA